MNGKKVVRGTILTAFCMAAMLYVSGTVSRAYWVVVKSDNTRVRDAASTDSDVMTAVNAGDRLDVVSEEQGSDGNTWYKVSINNVSGYVRSDTVEKAAEGDESSAAAAQPVEASSSSTVEPMATQAATVKKDNVNVRKSASTSAGVVAKLPQGAAVTLTGTTSDSSGEKWYQVNFINNGSNVTGFIREDFVEPGEVMEPQAPAEETPEGDAEPAGDMPAENEPANNDYELFYEPDSEGVDCWYIHDNIAQKRYKLEQLMSAEQMNANNMAIKDKEIKRLKVILIVLAVILAAALAAAGIFGYKYFSVGYDDDDDDDDDFRAAPPARRREREASEAGSRRREAGREEERGERRAVRRTEAGEARRPVNGARRPEGESARQNGAQPVRRRPEAEAQRRPAGGAARPRSEQPVDPARPRGERPADAARPRGAQPADPARPRSAQPALQGRKPQAGYERETERKSGRQDVEWRSKNFLAGEEDGLDFSFINGNDETFPE